jgi:hypothetical protein
VAQKLVVLTTDEGGVMLNPEVDETNGVQPDALFDVSQCARHVHDEQGKEWGDGVFSQVRQKRV